MNQSQQLYEETLEIEKRLSELQKEVSKSKKKMAKAKTPLPSVDVSLFFWDIFIIIILHLENHPIRKCKNESFPHYYTQFRMS